MTSVGGPPPGAGDYSGPGAHATAPAHAAPSGGGNGLAAEVHTLERAIFEVKRIIVGQDQLVERMLVGLLSKGHVLLEGVPGVAKTLAVETFARVVGGTFARIQFTPDLVPTDIIGTRIYRQGKEEFDTELGPVVVNFLLADEINRAPAKVQSALLEVMQERQVSIGGKRFPLPNPFLVMATQNPIEHEGVYPLPEAQRDRFLFKINVGYPSPEEEREIIYRMGLESAANKQIRYYSSGMKQRVRLAQALFSDTSVVLLDEPCTNLDVDGIALYRRLIDEYTAGRLVIVSSNDMQEYEFCEERIDIRNYR